MVDESFSGAPSSTWWARFGTFIVDLSKPEDDQIRLKIAAAIKKDSRVTSVRTGPPDSTWDRDETFYPVMVSDDENLLSGADHIHARRFGNPVAFTVHVPAKNQPRIHGELAQTDEYEVSWDGWTAVVAWPRNANEMYPPAAAGQIVVEILADALGSLEHRLLVQACSPACEHLFGHKDMRVSVWAGSDLPFEVDFSSPQRIEPVDVRIQGDLDPSFLTVALMNEVSLPGAAFARVKNGAKRILAIEQSLRRKTAQLLRLDYEALKRADVGFWRGLGHGLQDGWAFVRGRGKGRPVKRLISELWLQMAALETLQQAFADARRDYEDTSSEFATPALFDGDLKDDEAGVQGIDAGFARAAIENKSARMDTRGVVVATLVAAILGSGIGAAVGGIFVSG